MIRHDSPTGSKVGSSAVPPRLTSRRSETRCSWRMPTHEKLKLQGRQKMKDGSGTLPPNFGSCRTVGRLTATATSFNVLGRFHLPKISPRTVRFVSNFVEERRLTRIDEDEVFVISKCRRWSWRQAKDLGRLG